MFALTVAAAVMATRRWELLVVTSLLAELRYPAVMGVVNVTPDSFSDGGRFLDRGAAVEHGLRWSSEGADLVDVGGESTRPGSDPVPAEVELIRVIPVIERPARGGRGRSRSTR